MSRRDKLLADLLSGRNDNAIRFDPLCNLLVSLGFEYVIKGSHHIFRMPGVPGIINVQPRSDGTAKPYQVKQVRSFLTRNGIA